jgi:hypothetical protein
MKHSAHIGALAAAVAMIAMPLLAADPLPWPWKSKTPPDPALALLSRVDDVTVSINKSEPPTISITVKATAPTPGFTELQLTNRLGDPNDLKFEFDARGRPPQDTTTQVLTPVTLEASYADAPIPKVKVIEVYANENCIGYSVPDGKTTECKPKPPQQ